MNRKKKYDIDSNIQPHFLSYSKYDGVITSDDMSKISGQKLETIIRLNANENPYGTDPDVIKSLQNLQTHLYPDPNQKKIKLALSKYTGISSENLMAGAGGDEIIDLLMRLFVSPGEIVIDCPPTFGMYKFSSDLSGGKVISIERDEYWNLDLEKILQNSKTGKIIFIASPNNPTGNVLDEQTAKKILDTGILLVIDETYFEFSGISLSHLIEEYENLVILRSFSKWAGLAGLRIGYAIGSTKIINILMQIKQPYNINIAAEVAAINAINEKDNLLINVKKLIDQRIKLENFIETSNDKIMFFPSNANFLLCRFRDFSGDEIYDELSYKGIFVRKFSHFALTDCVRISSGTSNQTDTLIDVLKNIVS